MKKSQKLTPYSKLSSVKLFWLESRELLFLLAVPDLSREKCDFQPGEMEAPTPAPAKKKSQSKLRVTYYTNYSLRLFK
jgi:hypothetical protein